MYRETTLVHSGQKSSMVETNNEEMILFPTLKRQFKDGAVMSFLKIQIKLLIQIRLTGYYISWLRNALLFILHSRNSLQYDDCSE